jgi:dTDP-4-amino-4,6-dideoxygalactose transaminase
LLTINDDRFIKRAEIIWEKGTNRADFFRGAVNKYGWVDTGSSFLPSEIIAAYLWAQLEKLELIQKRRKEIWQLYYDNLVEFTSLNNIILPKIPDFAINNGHMFYLICKNENQRSQIIKTLKDNDIYAVFHYLSLHKSDYYKYKHDGRVLLNSDRYTDCLVRLPLYFDLTPNQIDFICNAIKAVQHSITNE